MCWDTILEVKGPVFMQFLGVAPLYDGVVADLGSSQLPRDFVELLGLERWSCLS